MNDYESHPKTIGQRFVRPEFQLVAALYALHFAVWLPFTLRHAQPAIAARIVIAMAPVIVCYLAPAIWNVIAKRDDGASGWSVSLLPTAHLILIVFTLLSLLLRAIGLDG